jgi:cytochrome c-type biogenesis protein CcmH
MLAALFLGLTLVVTSSTGTPDLKQAERIRNIEDSLLSPCCYGGQVSTHMSDIAAQMRQEITQMVLDGRSDREIRDYYVRQYGQQVLAEPEGPKRLMLYGIPITVTVVGILFVMAFLRKALQARFDGSKLRRSEDRADAAALQKVRAISEDF